MRQIWLTAFPFYWDDTMRRRAVLELHPYRCLSCSRRRAELQAVGLVQ